MRPGNWVYIDPKIIREYRPNDYDALVDSAFEILEPTTTIESSNSWIIRETPSDSTCWPESMLSLIPFNVPKVEMCVCGEEWKSSHFECIVSRFPLGVAESNREKLRKVAQETNAVAVGWFHCEGVRCPAHQARMHHQGFQEQFDRTMAVHFGHQIREDAETLVNPFVVGVES